MTNKPLEYYMALPELANEPSALREIHAIRLKVYDDEQGMTQEERWARIDAAVAHFFGDTPIRWATPHTPSSQQ
jgi:hypothetical protein